MSTNLSLYVETPSLASGGSTYCKLTVVGPLTDTVYVPLLPGETRASGTVTNFGSATGGTTPTAAIADAVVIPTGDKITYSWTSTFTPVNGVRGTSTLVAKCKSNNSLQFETVYIGYTAANPARITDRASSPNGILIYDQLIKGLTVEKTQALYDYIENGNKNLYDIIFALQAKQDGLLLGSPAVGAVAAVRAAVTDNGAVQTITTGITNPVVPRNLIATAGGTATDIKAIAVTVTGTDMYDAVISEVLPVFTVDTAGSVTGNKAFKTVTSISIPAHDGTGATTSVGTGAKLGVPATLSRNTILRAFLNDVVEATAPTVTVSATAVSSNTVTLNSALNGTPVRILL